MADATTPGDEEIETTNGEHDENGEPAATHEDDEAEGDDLDEDNAEQDEEEEDGGEA